MSTKKYCDFCEQEVDPPRNSVVKRGPGRAPTLADGGDVKLSTVQIYDADGQEKLSREFCSDCEPWVRRMVCANRLQIERMWAARDKT